MFKKYQEYKNNKENGNEGNQIRAVADCPIEEGGVVDVRSDGYSVVEGGYVLCGRHIWQYFPEEDVDCELVAE